ncbi:NADPH2:quinone reductase [Polychytrium aggregatum]|uniref:NADPH2:quinone reductase n=1 Tax=Polychytrium aggregatum TaxID=110093 RepID=UPI0022FE8004|nr:NADPH2:quinone reductase [Polychytrium aggregatum]KAI9204814.1 NADPH2:quinone reductase [Polychytrium aggregatum]
MKAIVVSQWLQSHSELAVSTSFPELPGLAPGKPLGETEVLVRVAAIGLNFFDALVVTGKHQTKPKRPFIPGAEFAGVVVAVGPKVQGFQPGDRVFGNGKTGCYAEYVLSGVEHIHKVPTGMSLRDAAGIFLTYPTSYAALVFRANLQPGEVCLVHAGAGGVGLAAIQIAKYLGATVIATAGSDDKLEICRSNGADHVINYKTNANWSQTVRDLTRAIPGRKHEGADVIYDPVGLVNDSTKCVAWNGRILVIGFAGGNIESVPTNRLLLKGASVMGVYWGAYAVHQPHKMVEAWKMMPAAKRGGSPGSYSVMNEGITMPVLSIPRTAQDLSVMFSLASAYTGQPLRPVTFPKVYKGLSSVTEGLSDLLARKTYGKVVVDLDDIQSKL